MEITVQHQSIEALLADPMVRALLASVSDGALVIDAGNRRVAAMNDRARGLLGYRRRDVLGCQCQKLMNSPACTLSCPLTALLEGRSEDGELHLYYRGKEGDQFLHAHTRVLLVRAPDGKPLAGIELFRDLREVARLKRAMRERATLHGIIGKAPAMQLLYEQVEQVIVQRWRREHVGALAEHHHADAIRLAARDEVADDSFGGVQPSARSPLPMPFTSTRAGRRKPF